MKTLHTIYSNFAKRNLASLRLLFITLLTLTVIINAQAETIASWGCISISANTNYKAIDGDANNKNVAQFSSSKAMITSGTNAYYGSSAGGAVITFSNLDLSNYTDVMIYFYSRASQAGSFSLSYSTDGTSFSSGNSSGTLATKNTPTQYSIDLPSNSEDITTLKLSHSKSSGSLYFGTVTITGTKKAAASYTITPQSNNTSYGTVSLSGTTITAIPNAGYRVKSGDAGYSIAAGSATVINNGDNTFSVTPSTDCTITINFEVIPTFTVNWYVNGSKEHSQTDVAGTALTNIPNLEDYECEDKVFVGWTTQSPYEHANDAPNDLIGEAYGMTIPESDVNYYAVFATKEGNGNKVSILGGTWTSVLDGWTYHDDAMYSGNGKKFDSTSDYVQTVDFSQYGYKAVSVDIKAGYNQGSGSGTSGSKLKISALGENLTELDSQEIIPEDLYTAQNTVYTVNLNATSVIAYVKVQMTYKTSNLGMKYCEVFASTTTYSNFTTDCTTETAVSLDPNGGTGTMGDVTTENGTLTLPKCTFTREGYTFAGWATSANGEVAFADEEVVSNWDADITELFAKWTAKTITITWDANGGSVNPTSSTYTYNGATITLPIPTRTGYSFNGWFTATTGGTQITEVGTTNKPTENVTYYAKWTEKALTRYRTDCDACIPLDGYAEIKGTYHFFPDETITLTVTPPTADVPYTYQWQKQVGEEWTNIDGATTTTYTKDETTIADAGRYKCVVSSEGYCDEIAEYNVKCLQLYVYYDNKSDVFNAPLKKVDGATATIDVELQNAGYTYYFKITDGCGNWYGYNGDIHSGWCTNVEMNADAYCGLKTTKFGTYVFNVNYSDLTKLTVSVLYPSAYQAADKVIYLDNHVLDWTNSNNAEGKNKIYYRIGRSDHNSKTAMTKVPGTANLYKVTTGEYNNFDVWHIANNGCWSDGNSIYKTNTGDDWAATQATAFETLPVTLAAVTVTPTTSRSVGGDENNNNCEFYNYNITEGMKTWNAEVIEPTNGTITVKYTHHDGTAVNDFTSGTRDLAHTCLLTITATPNVGYSLVSLTVNDEPFTSGNIHTLTADAVIKATFTINTHVLTWNVNGGNSLTGEYTQGSVDYGTPITPPADPTRAGHTFKGWIDQNGQTTVQTTMPDYDLTYTAQWQINQYTVTLNPNYPAGKTGTFTDKDGNTINGNLELIYDYNTASKTITDLYTSLTLDGYEFGGWYNANGSNPGEVSGSKCTVTDNITGNKTYYAKWTKLYSITLSENGTTKELAPQTSTSYTLPTELSVGTCDNDENELVGWSTVTIPTPGDKPTTNFYDLGETVTLTADQTIFYAVFAKPNMDAKETSIAGGDMVKGAPDGWVTSGTGTYSNHGVKFDDEGDYILSPSLGEYSDLLIKLKAGHNSGSGSVLTFYAYKYDDSMFGEDEVTIAPATITPTDSYTSQQKEYEISIEADEPIKYIAIWMKSKYKNLGMEYCEIFALPQKYFDYTTTCLSKHSITYDFNGGEGNCENEKVTHGEDYTICDEEPTNAGYTFLYWANGEDTYAPGTTIENVQADITLTATWQEREKYTLTFNDQGDTKEFQYIESLPVEMQEPWADICSGPIQYVFDGWAKAPVNNGTTEYEKVDFSTFTMPAENTTLYAVYRYAEEGSGDDDYHLVEEELTDYSGDYLIVSYDNNYAMSTSAEDKIGTNTYAAYVDISEYYADKIIESNSTTDTYVFTATKTTNGYSLCCKQNNTYLAILNTSTGTGTVLRYYEESVYNTKLSECEWSIGVGSISNYAHSSYNQYIRWNDNPKRFAIYTPSSVKGIHLYKKGIGASYIYTSSLICGSITAEDALVTSTKDQKVKVKVPIMLESSTGATTINATSDNAAFDVKGLTDVEAGDHTIVVEYTPAEYNITETANITLSATNGATTTFTVSGRSLPETFAIVAKVGNIWYALPSQGLTSETIPVGCPIEVDNNDNPTTVTAVPANADWSLRQVSSSGANDRYTANGANLVFVNAENKTLYASNSNANIQTYAEYSNYAATNPDRYEWLPTTTDLATYTLKNVGREKNLSINTNATFGTHASNVASSNIRFLPIQNRYTPLTLQVVEWKENSVVIMYNGNPAETAYVSVNGGTAEETMLSSAQCDIAVYELAATDLAANPTQRLSITIGTEKVILSIPYIINSETTDEAVLPGSSVPARQEVAKVSDLVILKGATLTAAGAGYKFRNVTIYGGGKLVIPSEKGFGVNSLTLRAGGVTADGNYDYVYPQFVLNGTWSNTSGKINLDYLTTKEQYYTFVAPFAVQTKDIHYPVDIYGSNVKADNKGSFEFEYYDGETRATTGATGWKTVEEGTDGATLNPGQGYTFLGMPKKVSVNGGSSTRQTFGIHRIPMIVTAEQARTHENSEQTITVAPHPAERNINAGWNLIGNPYMSTITGLNNESIQTGTIVWEDNKWEWSTDDTYNQRFIVFPSNDGQWYTTAQASNAILPAFKNFFVQIIDEAANALVIPHTSRTNPSAAPARHAAEEIDRDIELAIVLEKDEQNADQMDFLLNNTYGPAFDRNADFTKMMNNTNFNLYGVHMDDCLSFVAIDQYTAKDPVAIGYQVPEAGEYMLRMSDKPYVMADRIKALYVTDHEMTPEVTTDILKEPYRFTVGKAETNHTRFTISIELKPNTGDGVTTGWENVDVGKDQPIKFIYQDKLYILRNGVIYDATGKFVQTINK